MRWLRPNGKNLSDMLALVQASVREKRGHIEFMLHSSEFMPGGSPKFGTANDIDKLYGDLEALFPAIARAYGGVTLADFAAQYGKEYRP